MFDITMAVLALPVVLPVVGFLALLIACSGSKPFYSQDMIGKGGRVYRMWKLRSIGTDSDANSDHSLHNDPHVTWFDRFVRKSSVDELPQLFNVLIGDMSLVGPRPIMVSQKALYHGEGYYDLRPGITGRYLEAITRVLPYARTMTTFIIALYLLHLIWGCWYQQQRSYC